MYTILMDETKEMNATVKTSLMQRELSESIQFLFPLVYEGTNLSECTVIMKYKTHIGTTGVEILEKDAAPYKGIFLRCILPVTNSMDAVCGDVIFRITFLKADENGKIVYSLHTKEGRLYINPVPDFFEFVCDEDGSAEKLDSILATKLADYKEKSLIAKSDGEQVIVIPPSEDSCCDYHKCSPFCYNDIPYISQNGCHPFFFEHIHDDPEPEPWERPPKKEIPILPPIIKPQCHTCDDGCTVIRI